MIASARYDRSMTDTSRLALATTGVAAALLLSGCSSAPEAAVTPAPTITVTATTEAEVPAPSPEVTLPAADDLSCDTMLEPLVVDTMEAMNLTSRAKPLGTSIGEVSGPSLSCGWGFDGQMHPIAAYGWGAITAEERDALIAAMVPQGGSTVTTDARGTWEVDIPGPSPLVFLVADDWVAFAPSVELIDAIVWTR